MIDVSKKCAFLLKIVKAMIKKHQPPTYLSLRVKPMKEGHVKCIRDCVIISPSVSENTEDESDFQRFNSKAIKS